MDIRSARGRARPRTIQQPQPVLAVSRGLVATMPAAGAWAGAWGAGNPLRNGENHQPTQPEPQKATPVSLLPPSDQPPTLQARIEKARVMLDVDENHNARARTIARPENTITTSLTIGKQGVSGNVVKLQTNYFRFDKRPDWCIYQYRADFVPDVDVTSLKKRLFYNATKTLNIKGLFDGSMMFTPNRIHPDPVTFVVNADPDGKSDKNVHISIRMVGEIERNNYHYLQVYNLILRKCMSHLKLQLVGRDYYDPARSVPIQALNMELWPGILSSIRQHERDVLLCAEIKYKVMKNDTALDVYMRLVNDPRTRDRATELYNERMLTAIVLTDYNNKTYRVDDINYDMSPASTFCKSDGTVESFAQYYKSRYGKTIRNMSQPLLVSKARPRDLRAGAPDVIQLIPELCRITGITQEERENRPMMRQIAEKMQQTPQHRINALRGFNNRLSTTGSCMEELQQWDMALSKDVLSLTGRRLPLQMLVAGGGSTFQVQESVDWTSNVRSQAMFRNGVIESWAVICAREDERGMRAFLDHMKRAAQGMAWSLPPPKLYFADGLRAQSFHQAIEAANGARFYFVCTTKSGPIYDLAKKKLTVDKGVPSQMIARQTLNHKNIFSVATKVIGQMNCKTGGAIWTIRVPFENWMVCGFDVCHDPKNKSKSFGAFVASYDKNLTAYNSTCAHHRDGEEISNFIGLAFATTCSRYMSQNKKLPDKILFYRDGVGDGQLNYVYEHEKKIINEHLTKIYAAQNKTVKLRMIIVNKRINTRFFLNGNNPNPGTVVDDVVTLPDRTDFFLVPQCTRQGTVTPTYFNILGPDEFGLDLDKTQMITYRLCHQYYNWSGTVRVPAPCQYAHKLAFLTAQHLQRSPTKKTRTSSSSSSLLAWSLCIVVASYFAAIAILLFITLCSF